MKILCWMILVVRPAFFLLTILVILNGCSQGSIVEVSGKTMGTYYKVKYIEKGLVSKKADVEARIEKILKSINDQMSTYQTDSEISKFNALKASKPFSIRGEFAKTMELALGVARKTKGAFDPTIGPLVDLWGFGPEKKQSLKEPSQETIDTTKKFVGYDKLQVRMQPEGEIVLEKAHEKLHLDLSAIAKGFAVDEVSRGLTDLGVQNHLVEIGGEIRVSGKKKKGQLWTVAIESPMETSSQVASMVKLANQSIATSGNYRNFKLGKNGTQLGHTIDVLTGRPSKTDVLSASVVHSECALADAYATALMAMGAEKAQAFVLESKLAAFLIFLDSERNVQTRSSPEWKKLL